MWLACTPHLWPPPLFPQTKCLHVYPPLHLPPFRSHRPLHPYSSLFITRSWVVEEGLFYIVLAFTGSNPLHKVDGREPGKPTGTFWAEKGRVAAVLNRLWASRGPPWCDGMKCNKPEFTRPELKQVVLFGGWGARCSFLHSVHISFCVCMCVGGGWAGAGSEQTLQAAYKIIYNYIYW